MISNTTDCACVSLALDSMHTRFEMVLYGEDDSRLQSAGEEAISEIEEIAGLLSRFEPSSDISAINRSAGKAWTRVDGRTLELIRRCKLSSDVLEGAFDLTITPAMDVWGFYGDGKRAQLNEEPIEAILTIGMDHILLDPDDSSIMLDKCGMALDLGAVGKGYAIERAVKILRDCGVKSGMVHGGTSSIYAIGVQPTGSSWSIAIRDQIDKGAYWQTIYLRDAAVSVSATHGKSITRDGREYGHIIDPRTKNPVAGQSMAAVVGPDSVICEVLSTAAIVLGDRWTQLIAGGFGDYKVCRKSESGMTRSLSHHESS